PVVSGETEREPAEERREEGLRDARSKQEREARQHRPRADAREEHVAASDRRRADRERQPRPAPAIEQPTCVGLKEEDSERGHRLRDPDRASAPTTIEQKRAQVRRAEAGELREEEIRGIEADAAAAACEKLRHDVGRMATNTPSRGSRSAQERPP